MAADWHDTAAARALLAALGPADLRLIRDHHGLAWHPSSDHAATTFEALADLRQQAVGPAFTQATDAVARAAALAAAQRAPTVTGAIAARFGDPDRWQGFGPIEATRRFRAWAGGYGSSPVY